MVKEVQFTLPSLLTLNYNQIWNFFTLTNGRSLLFLFFENINFPEIVWAVWGILTDPHQVTQ